MGTLSETNAALVPRHIGYILDGNRRWARQHSLPEFDGHMAGYSALMDVVEASFQAGVEYVSLYAFSTENWQRDKKEVSNLMKLAVHAFSKDMKRLVKNRIRVRFLGVHDGLSGKLLDVMEKAEAQTRLFEGHTLAICFNYGGQLEIVDAVKRCYRDGLTQEQINEATISERLYAPDVPPLDMVVRTSGEQRLSNFMTWRTVYSELLFLEKYWPDMRAEDVRGIIAEYNRRQRRFGQ
jgi:undecaprenyl diphosphate synthase